MRTAQAEKKIRMCQHRKRAVANMAWTKDAPGLCLGAKLHRRLCRLKMASMKLLTGRRHENHGARTPLVSKVNERRLHKNTLANW